MGLSAKHLAFATELVADPSFDPGKPVRGCGRAYARVYGGDPDARHSYSSGFRLLRRADVAAEVTRLYEAAKEAAGITSDEVVREITLLAKADPRGLFEVHRGACRYCYGRDHLYQRTPRELREALADYIEAHKLDDPNGIYFDHAGGIGFNATRVPYPKCPECFGLGEVYEYLKDSRTWTPGAAKLFAGVERTRDGIKVKTRSQDRALQLAAGLHHLLRAPEPGEGGEDIPEPSAIVYEAQDASKPGRKR